MEYTETQHSGGQEHEQQVTCREEHGSTLRLFFGASKWFTYQLFWVYELIPTAQEEVVDRT